MYNNSTLFIYSYYVNKALQSVKKDSEKNYYLQFTPNMPIKYTLFYFQVLSCQI